MHTAYKPISNWIHLEIFCCWMVQSFYSCHVPPTQTLLFTSITPGGKLKAHHHPLDSGFSNQSQKQRLHRPVLLPSVQCLLLKLLSVNCSAWAFWHVLELCGWIHWDMAHYTHRTDWHHSFFHSIISKVFWKLINNFTCFVLKKEKECHSCFLFLINPLWMVHGAFSPAFCQAAWNKHLVGGCRWPGQQEEKKKIKEN